MFSSEFYFIRMKFESTDFYNFLNNIITFKKIIFHLVFNLNYSYLFYYYI